MPPLMDHILDDTFQQLEKDLIQFKIGDEEFKGHASGWYISKVELVSWFVKAILQLVGSDERKFTSWQESDRKDIERAFGALK